MANVNAPAGLVPVEYQNGAPWTGGGRVYYIAADDTNPYSIGDVVKSSGDGDANGVAGVTLGTAGAAMRGVIVSMGGPAYGGVLGDVNNLNIIQIPATKTQAYYVLVVDDPNVIFEIQEIGTGTLLTSAAIGLNANFVYAAPATGVLVSGTQLDNTTEATDSSLNLKILGLSQRPGNAFGQYQKWLVLPNNHELRAGTTGV